MSRALACGTALAELDLAPWKPHASAWNGKVQTLQPKGQQVRASRGSCKHHLEDDIMRAIARQGDF